MAAMPNIFEILSREEYHSDVLKVSKIDLHCIIFLCVFLFNKIIFSTICDYFEINVHHFFILLRTRTMSKRKQRLPKKSLAKNPILPSRVL